MKSSLLGLLFKYIFDDQTNEERWAGMWLIRGKTETLEFLVEKPERKRPLGKCMYRWENTEIELKETGWDGMD
jgi:hypothetical protein